MPLILQYLLAIGSFQGLLLFSLLSFSAQSNVASRILGGWCFFLALGFMGPFLTIEREVNMFSSLIGWSLFLPASYGGFLYLYCKHSITNKPLRVSALWHFTPLLMCYLLNIDMLLESSEVKLLLATSSPPTSVSFLLSRMITYIQAFAYLGVTIYLVQGYQTTAKNTLAGFNPDKFNWLWRLLLLAFLIWSLKAVSHLSENIVWLAVVGDLLIIVLIYSVAMVQWRNPEIFRIEQINQSVAAKESASLGLADKEFDISERKGVTGNLDRDTGVAILTEVKQYMQKERAYTDDKLTLNHLSAAVGISTHHLSEALNQQEGKNFYQFVNEYRIGHICAALQQQPKAKIFDIALAGGFSSKSTFNTVFKKYKGVTPTQYRKDLSR